MSIVDELKEMLMRKNTYLCEQRNGAVSRGDIEAINAIDNEISEVENAMRKL